MNNLRSWSKENFGHVMKDVEKLHAELADLKLVDADRMAIRPKMNQLDELLYRDDMLWLQRSRITWIKEGQGKTKYFFWRAVWRALKNHIRRLRKQDGTWCKVPYGL